MGLYVTRACYDNKMSGNERQDKIFDGLPLGGQDCGSTCDTTFLVVSLI